MKFIKVESLKFSSLKRHSDFGAVFKNSLKASNSVLAVYIQKPDFCELSTADFEVNYGLIVPKRVISKAVDRNYVKRYLKSSLRSFFCGYEFPKGHSVRIILRVLSFFDRKNRPDINPLLNNILKRYLKNFEKLK